MPTIWAHGLYFNNSSTQVAPVIQASGGGYPLWQAGVITPSLLGGLQTLWERVVWWCQTLRSLWKLPRWKRGSLDLALKTWLGPLEAVGAISSHPIAKPGVVQVRHTIVAPRATVEVVRPFWVRWAKVRRKAKPEVKVPEMLGRTASLLAHPAYPKAKEAVEKTAQTLGFNRPEAWQQLSRQMKADPGTAENVYRHLQACQWTKQEAPSTLTNPDCNLLVELAYHEWAAKHQ